MGQTNQGQNLPSGQYSIVREVPNGSIVRESANGRLHFVKQYSFTNQEAYQQAFVNFSKKLPEKHQHILYLERTNTKLENTFCSTFYKISLLYEYLDHTLDKEIKQRTQEKKIFDEKEVWSVLCSCALAVSEMIRFQGRSHAALRTKDLRLTHEGIVKILSLEMVGMEPDHDPNQEGTVKQLALTILNCILMDQITNQSEEYLQDLIEALDSSPEMKNILKIMLNPSTRFIDLEEYLFKLVQEDTESLNSQAHTPIIKDKTAKNNNSYSRIPEESKEDDSLNNLARDIEDNPENVVIQPFTQEQEIPDENDIIDDGKSKAEESQRGTLRDRNSNETPTSQKNDLECSKKQEFSYSSKNENSLFTDPKLLNLINSNLEEINKRKSIANSRKLGFSESTSKMQRSDSKQLYPSYNNIINTNSSINLGLNPKSNVLNNEGFMMAKSQQASTASLNIVNTNTSSGINIKQSNVSSNSNVKATSTKENENSRVSVREEKSSQSQVKSVAAINPVKIEENIYKSQKNIAVVKSNPEDKKNLNERKYENIMEMEDMGFKKNKVTKAKQEVKEVREVREDIRTTFNLSNSNVNTVVYNSNTSSYNSNTLPLSNYAEKQTSMIDNSRATIQYSINEPRQEYEHVSETYLKGKYEGTKLNNMRHGNGTFYYNQGGKYVGEWKENKMDGKGTLYYPNNTKAYQGDWKEDQLEGRGTLYNEEVCMLNVPFDYKDWEDVDEFWVKYEGQFHEDSKNGQGKLYLSNGQIFQGNFKDDMVWGEGILYRKDNSRVRGLWRQNKLIKLF